MIRTITKKVETNLPESVYHAITKIGSEIGVGKSTIARICLHATLDGDAYPLIPNLLVTLDERKKMIEVAKDEAKKAKPDMALSINVSKLLRKQIEDKAEMYDLTRSEIARLFIISALDDVDKIKEFSKNINQLDSLVITDANSTDPKQETDWLWSDNGEIEA